MGATKGSTEEEIVEPSWASDLGRRWCQAPRTEDCFWSGGVTRGRGKEEGWLCWVAYL